MKKKKEKAPKSGKKKFVLSIGDEGAILLQAEGNKMTKRLFITSPSSQEFLDALASAPKAPIYILADVMDQAYVQHTLPPVSPLNINKLVQRKLAKDFEAADLKSAISLGRDKSGRKDWNYLFVSVRYIPPFSEWIDAISELPNRCAGIYLLPVEATNYLKDLKKIVVTDKDHKESTWQILVSHNRVGGFRQIVFKDKKIIFTRIAQPIGGQTPDIVAGNIEQETLNTIEYIRRLGYKEEDGLDIFIIASSEAKEVLEVNALPCTMLSILTPFEIANQFRLETASEKKDRYGDVILAIHFLTRKKHFLRLQTNYLAKVDKLVKANFFVRLSAAAAIAFLVISSGISIFNIFDYGSKIEMSKADIKGAEARLAEAYKFKDEFSKEPDLIKEAVSLNDELTKNNVFPLDLVGKYASVRGFNTYVTSLNMDVTENSSEDIKLNANFDIEFFSLSKARIDELLDDLDLFTSDIKRKFEDYDVEFSGLPDQQEMKIELGSSGFAPAQTAISLKISGPVEKDTRGKRF